MTQHFSTDAWPTYVWQDSLNRLSLGLRNFVQWRRPGYQETPLEPSMLADRLATLPQGVLREEALRIRYRLEPLRHQAALDRYLETLTFLEALENLFSTQAYHCEVVHSDGVAIPIADSAQEIATAPLQQLRCFAGRSRNDRTTWLDVGARNWSYVEALYRFLETHTEGDFLLHGIEIDGYRLFDDLHSRADYAEAYIKDLLNARYEVGDVMDHTASYDVISCFLPFVFLDPCLDWGLTRQHFRPEAFLCHLVSRLNPGGTLIVLNQGEDEAEVQAQLFAQLETPVTVTTLGALPPSFWPYEIPRYAWRCQKGDAS